MLLFLSWLGNRYGQFARQQEHKIESRLQTVSIPALYQVTLKELTSLSLCSGKMNNHFLGVAKRK